MNLTVIIDDEAIYIDGFVVRPADMSWFNPDDYDRKVNAIQWEEDSGEIEYTEGPPTPIDNIDFLKDVITIHQLAKEELKSGVLPITVNRPKPKKRERRYDE